MPVWIAMLATLALVCVFHLKEGVAGYARPGLNEYWFVAEALASGRGFADPFGVESGPTAWVAPLPVFIVHGLSSLAGGIQAGFLAFGLAKAAGYALCAGLWARLALRHCGEPAAWAFTPLWLAILAIGQGRHLNYELHDPWLVCLLLALTLEAADHWRTRAGRLATAAVFAAGAWSGPVLAATQAALVCGRLACCARGGKKLAWRAGLRPFLPALVAAAVAGGAWMTRNRIELGVWAPIKSNGAYEAWQAQCATEDGVPGYATFMGHPFLNEEARAAFVAEGEVAYVRRHGEVFGRELARRPMDFLRRAAWRAVNAGVFLEQAETLRPVYGSLRGVVSPGAVQAGLLVFGPGGKLAWGGLDQPEREWRGRLEAVSDLDASRREVLLAGWRAAKTEWTTWPQRARRSAAGVLLAGLPACACAWLAWTACFGGKGLRRSTIGAWPLVYVAYLAPYVLVSHYDRYQAPLAGIQALFLAAAIGALIRRKASGPARGGGLARA